MGDRPKAPNEVRIRQLEQTIEALSAQVARLQSSVINDEPPLRIAKVLANPASGDELSKIQFIKATHDGGFSGGTHSPGTKTFATRSDSQQHTVARFHKTAIPKGVIGPVFRTPGGQLFHLPPTGGFGKPTATIDGRVGDTPGVGTFTVWRLNETTGEAESTGLVITIKNIDPDPVGRVLIKFNFDWFGEPILDCCNFGSISDSTSVSESLPSESLPSESLPSESTSISTSESGTCVLIPGVDLAALPSVSAADADAVLGVQNGCLVAISLAACDTGSGSV